MLALLQRVREAQVEVVPGEGGEPQTTGAIGQGLLMLVCAEPADTEAIAARLVAKVLKLRIFADDAGKMNRGLVDVGGGLLVVSQFTLAADTSGGNRPTFGAAAPPEQGLALYESVLRLARAQHAGPVEAGRFGAEMRVHLVNDGPVTIPLTLR